MSGRLAKLCTTTTCHGIIDLYESTGKIAKLFWAIVLLAAFGAIGYYQYNLVATFISNPTATKISKIVADSLAFPNVTVCNQNAYSMAKMNAQFATVKSTIVAEMGNSSTAMELLDWIRLATMSAPTVDPLQSTSAAKEFQILFNSSYPTASKTKFDLATFLSGAGYSCSDILPMVGDCLYEMTPFNCCTNAAPILTQFGNCYKVTPTKTANSMAAPYVTQVQPGINSGLEITMTYNSTDIPPFNYNNNNVVEVSKEGFYLSIGEHMSSLDYAAVTVGPGMYVSVNLALNKYVYDPSITTCTQSVTPLSYTKNGVTSVHLCKQECQVAANLRFVGCSPVYPNVQLPADKICSPSTVNYYFWGLTNMVFNGSYRWAVQSCQANNCPKLCDTRMYVPFAVYSTVAPEHRTGQLDLETSVANIFFGELAYTLIEEKPLMDVTSLICGFGGNLGLFAGMSLITIVQCLAAFVCAFNDRIPAKFKQNLVQKIMAKKAKILNTSAPPPKQIDLPQPISVPHQNQPEPKPIDSVAIPDVYEAPMGELVLLGLPIHN